MRIEFWGGIDTVTGSQSVLKTNGTCVLRDCGLFQGRRQESREINRRFPFDVSQIDTLVLSHAHIDHCGNIPSLVRYGFRNPIHTTTATAALCQIMLRDAAYIQEQDAAYLNQKTSRKGQEPIEPLYTLQDAEDSFRLFCGHQYEDSVELSPSLSVSFRDAGHILGAALTTFTVREKDRVLRVAFAVDLGRYNLPLIRDPEILRNIDVLVLESTYGDRLHDAAEDAREQLRIVVDRTLKRGGKVIIPSFALERAQEIIYHLASLVNEGRLPPIPVFVDSPMATAVAGVFEAHTDYLDEEFKQLREKMGSVMRPKWLTYTGTVEESKAITASTEPCIVIAASGMCEHGRILHHLKHGIEDPKNTIVIVGFQAKNTLGRRLVDGEINVRIFGEWYRRKAEVVVLNAFSAHADKNELVAYVQQVSPKQIYLVHGESQQREALAGLLRQTGFSNVYTPKQGDAVNL